MSDSLQALEDLYFALRQLRLAPPEGATPEQLSALDDAYFLAQANYHRAINKVLNGDNALVQKLTSQLKDAQAQIDASLESEKKFASTLQLITAAVHLASSVAGFFL